MPRRRNFLRIAGLAGMLILLGYSPKPQSDMDSITPEQFVFKDDGKIPNNSLPLLLYRDAFENRGDEAARWLEEHFKENNWYNSWRWGVFPYHHYHSTSHEVLGCFRGNALLHLGGENGKKVEIEAGDIVIIPAGVGHKCISHSSDFTVVGAYPNGSSYDLMRGEDGERPQADKNIENVPVPEYDPYLGKQGGLVDIWKAN